MARMPVLAGCLMVVGLVLTTGCQSTPTKKPPAVPTTWNTPPQNSQVAGGNGNPSKFPQVPAPAPTPNTLPVAGGGTLSYPTPPSNPNLGNPGGVNPLILPVNRNNTLTTPNSQPDPTGPILLPTPPSTNTLLPPMRN